ncbi:MAG: hypothetical protein SGJ27_06590 [Candidatus Melainabacteria bacterium]|mgnify:CR=1 FL=1|nr:hypothetical protein [Candidatus Melainabacteria bacterium]
MSSEKDQETYKQPNYADHLKRVRQVKRTLDVNFPAAKQPANQAPAEGDHHSHESIKDQAVSRKTRRPAEDYEIGKGLFGAEAQSGSGTPVPAENHPASAGQQWVPPKPVANIPAKPAESPVLAKPAEQMIPKLPVEGSSKVLSNDELASADKKNKGPVVRNDFGNFDGGARAPGSTQFFAKTLLDHNAILKAQALRQKARVEQELSKRQQAPVKIIEPIKAQKEVRSCPFSWTEDSSTERFKHCSKCQSTVYNFNGMEFSEVENLIFTRENIKKFVLFKRQDGKFMTSDCPVEQKRKQQIIGIVAVCIILVACVAGVLIMMPPAPSPTVNSWNEPAAPAPNVDNGWDDPSPDAVSSGSEHTDSKPSATKSSGTSQHYEAGDALPTVPATGVSTTSPTQKPVNESEEKGDFWEFSGQ